MAGRLITLSSEFFDDFEVNTKSMQFSGDNNVARDRLKGLVRFAFPRDWSDLVRWPVQCDCGHTMEFSVPYYLAELHCGNCEQPLWSVDLWARMTKKSTDGERYSMLVAVIHGSHAMGEQAASVLSFVSRMAETGDGLAADVAEDLGTLNTYRNDL